MKTNVVMIRPMGQLRVEQRTNDYMFNASSLLKQYCKVNGVQKKVSHFIELQSTKEFMEVLNNEVGRDYTHSVTRTKTNKDGSKEPGETWMHPYLFIDFAMWINPKFKLDVIKFVYDQLIKLRHDAGDNYRGLTKAVEKFKDTDYRTLAKALNYVVFGYHNEGLRQTANEQQLRELTDIQKKFAFAVDMGYINSFNQLLSELRKIWHAKNHQLILS